jgi:hypothetical protein
MLCEMFDARMHEMLDQRERPELDARLRDHALTCDDCAEKLAAQAALLDGLKAMRAPEPGQDFTHAVLAGVRPRETKPAWGKIVWSLVALAAVLLVAVVPLWWLLGSLQKGARDVPTPGADGPSVAQDRLVPAPEPRPTPRPAAVVASESNANPDPPVEEPGPSMPLDSEPAESLPDKSAVAIDSSPPPEDNSPGGLFGIEVPWEIAGNLPGVDERQAQTLQSVLTERVTTPLRPVTSSVTGAVNILRRTLAVGPALQSDNDDQKPQAGVIDGVRIKDLV